MTSAAVEHTPRPTDTLRTVSTGSDRRVRLERWFGEGVGRIHCLAWDAATGLRWAQLLAHLRTSGRAMPIKDSLIAATALTHGLVVATRNRRDFEPAGVEMVDPFAPES